MKKPLPLHTDEVILTDENPCRDGICGERLCGRMRNELKFLSFLADADLDEVAGYFECRQVQAGKTLWEAGDPGNFIAFVISGRIQINKKTELGGKSIILGVFSRGAILGEVSFLEGGKRSETAAVLDHADLILLTRESFQRLLDERPRLGIKLLEGMLVTVSRRLRKSYERLASIF